MHYSVAVELSHYTPSNVAISVTLVSQLPKGVQLKSINSNYGICDTSAFPRMALITFSDEVKIAAFTRDLAVLRGAIEDLTASGGGLCPEASIEALSVAVPHTRAGGDILFSTDASPYPDADVKTVMIQLRSKGIRFNAMITGDCSMQDSWN
mgnify:CR=1 FL=1